jgi:hypothetical protein
MFEVNTIIDTLEFLKLNKQFNKQLLIILQQL